MHCCPSANNGERTSPFPIRHVHYSARAVVSDRSSQHHRKDVYGESRDGNEWREYMRFAKVLEISCCTFIVQVKTVFFMSQSNKTIHMLQFKLCELNSLSTNRQFFVFLVLVVGVRFVDTWTCVFNVS